MKRSHFFLSLALGAALAITACVVDRWHDLQVFTVRAIKAVRDWLAGASLDFAKLAGASTTGPRLVGFVQAKAFVRRVIKRERPVISALWRMCPSV